jgi:hypothetical protein
MTVTPNFDNLLWIILIMSIIGNISSIILGLIYAEKKTHYGATDVISALISLSLIIWFVVL